MTILPKIGFPRRVARLSETKRILADDPRTLPLARPALSLSSSDTQGGEVPRDRGEYSANLTRLGHRGIHVRAAGTSLHQRCVAIHHANRVDFDPSRLDIGAESRGAGVDFCGVSPPTVFSVRAVAEDDNVFGDTGQGRRPLG